MRSLSALLVVISGTACAQSPYSIPYLDLDDHVYRQVVVDHEPGQYLGHPSTLLLEDGKSILCVYPKGHGRGPIIYRRSSDGGRTWSQRIDVPSSWATSRETPTLHRVIGPNGTKRIIMFSGLYPCRMAVSKDDGATWSELKSIGNWGGIVTMGFVEPLKTGRGHYLAMFHDDGRFFTQQQKQEKPVRFKLFQTVSTDGGLTWNDPTVVESSTTHHLCEPGVIRSPDGSRLAVLLRENSRRHPSQIIFSHDEGETWTQHRSLPASLNGDRHTGRYLPDGRIFISFRSRQPEGVVKPPHEGDWVGWLGTWEDLVHGNEGQYVVRLKDNKRGADCAYPGVEVLPDGTIVTTTYGHWTAGQQPYILTVRLKAEELDALSK